MGGWGGKPEKRGAAKTRDAGILCTEREGARGLTSETLMTRRIGTEHEKLGYDVATERRMEYPVVEHVLRSLVDRHGWEPNDEGENIIGCSKGGQSVSLEPGGQFELSGAPLENLRQTEAEVRWHIETVTALAEERGHKFLGIGFDPQWSVAEVPMMPKGRYKIMRAYMPSKGTRGLDMMFRTCTIQVNLDFEDERDMVRKFRTSLALQPIATAMFANSAFVDGRDTGYQSMRSDVWKDTDDDRTGMLAWVFEDDFGFEKYCDYVMDVPMYFVYRNGTYVDVSGESWHDFMEGKLPQLPGDTPTIDDWEQHLTTVFPEVRLKRYMEMRGADGGSFEAIMALPALWVGLLYSSKSLDAAEKLTSDWTQAERDALRNDVTKDGLSTKFRDGTANDIAKEMVRLAADGLKERGLGEEVYLKYLQTVVERGSSNAARMSELNASEWKDDLSKVYEYATFPDVLPTF